MNLLWQYFSVFKNPHKKTLMIHRKQPLFHSSGGSRGLAVQVHTRHGSSTSQSVRVRVPELRMPNKPHPASLVTLQHPALLMQKTSNGGRGSLCFRKFRLYWVHHYDVYISSLWFVFQFVGSRLIWMNFLLLFEYFEFEDWILTLFLKNRSW